MIVIRDKVQSSHHTHYRKTASFHRRLEKQMKKQGLIQIPRPTRRPHAQI
jgi:hypothetical protein